MVKQVLARGSKEERRADRARFGTLQGNLVGDITLRRYEASFDLFVVFFKVYFKGTSRFVIEHVDMAFAAYLESLWHEGDGKTQAEYAYAAICHFIPRVRGNLPSGMRLLSGWRRMELPARATPITYDILLAICGLFCH